jgi:hypothetical protein
MAKVTTWQIDASHSSVEQSTSLPSTQRNVCPQGTQWHRLRCARQCAQTRSDDHPPAANANQGTLPEATVFQTVAFMKFDRKIA